MKVGDFYREEFIISQDDVLRFSEISGDKNPIHLDYNYAKGTIFKKPIIHGFLISSRFSKVLGVDFPGEGTIYLKQSLKFLMPAFVDVVYVVELRVLEIIKEKHRLRIETKIFEKSTGKDVIVGEAFIQNNNLILE